IIFERFLNPERISMPDIDVDFCMRGRDQVIQYVRDKYDDAERGDEGRRVAQIITFGKLQARAAIRDVGRVLGMPYGDVDRIAKLVPETLGITLSEAIEQSPDLRARRDNDGQVLKLLDVAQRLEGLTRHASTHAAGVVIGNRPLIDVVPLYKDPRSGDVLTQIDWKAVEKIGLIKFDFLGLKTLTVIDDAERRIRAQQPGFSVEQAPLDDETTYALLGRGDTVGVFQIESAGMTELTVKLRPTEFKELIAIVALYRPGPLNSGMVEDYISRKHGLTKVEYLHPEIEELTRSTLGVIVYQDQVLQIANQMAGYSLGEADLLRRAMGKKVPEEMEKQRDRFVSGATERGVDQATSTKVFNLMAEFAAYGFPKAHSTAYALITYQTAYLKANHPREFLAALMTVESGNNDKLARIIAHSREKELEILPPDVNASSRDFTVVEEGIRFGLAGVKNVGSGAIDAILQAREEDGPFASLFDFASRVDARRVNRRVVESLVKCGSFDSIHEERSRVWAALDRALESGAAAQRDREIGQENLFSGAGAAAVPEPELPEAAPWVDRERLASEKEVLGFYVTGHPLAAVAAELRAYADVTAGDVEGREGREVRAGGLLTGLRETRTRRGALMAFGTLEDLEGSFDLVIFNEPYERLREMLKKAKDDEHPEPLLITGTLEAGDTPKILVRDGMQLTHAREHLASKLELEVVAGELSRDRLQALRRVLEAHRGDCAVLVHLMIPGESQTVLALSDKLGVEATDALVEEVNALFARPVARITL
ncbi:MAG: DNA polymerase III subunit alpha, partial [Deltaproteobacteria bacterium]|nr:DNA polymerase III subunit alpha [Deltaproteobacteria bacterium]